MRCDPWLTGKQMPEQREAIARAGVHAWLRDAARRKPISNQERS